MTAVASEGATGARHQLKRRLRAAVLGPRSGGTTRRRASDAFRLGLAVVVVVVSILPVNWHLARTGERDGD